MQPAVGRGILLTIVMLTTRVVTYRTIDPQRDARAAVAHQRDACIASFGDDRRFQGALRYLKWLGDKVQEFPEGFLLARVDGRCVGQLELEVPYGLTTGYVNLFYVTPPFRGLGLAALLHERAELYFRSWEASRIELHVSPTNERALRFYQRMGYRRIEDDAGGTLWKMAKEL